MAFTVQDFRDLVRVLEAHPEWRAELRRLVLTEELLELPALVRELVEAQRRTEAEVSELRGSVAELRDAVAELRGSVAELAAAQRRTEAEVSELRGAVAELRGSVAELAAAQRRTEAEVSELRGAVAELRGSVAELRDAVAELAAAQQRTEGVLQELTRAQIGLVAQQARMVAEQERMATEQERMRGQFDRMRGDLLEIRYRNHAGAYFGPLVSRARVLQDQELTTLLDDARDAGVIADAERVDALLADLVVRGRRREDGTEVYLVVEVSVGIGPDDVRRAADRAAFIGKVQDAVPVVAGERITEDARDLAAARGVWTVLDGRATPPAGR